MRYNYIIMREKVEFMTKVFEEIVEIMRYIIIMRKCQH